MIRELIDMELDAVAGGVDFNTLINSALTSVSRSGNTQLNIQPQTATAGAFGVAQNFGGPQINSIG
jgi:hypothetical protein